MKRRLILTILGGLALAGCDTTSTQPATAKPHKPTAAELDQQLFARHAAALYKVYQGYDAELATLATILPTPDQQRTPSTKLTPAEYDNAHTIAQASQQMLSDLDSALLTAGTKPSGIPGHNLLHDELKPALYALQGVKLHTAHLAAQLREAHRTPPYRYISQASLLTAQRSLDSAREALIQTHVLLDQPTTARGLSLEALT